MNLHNLSTQVFLWKIHNPNGDDKESVDCHPVEILWKSTKLANHKSWYADAAIWVLMSDNNITINEIDIINSVLSFIWGDPHSSVVRNNLLKRKIPDINNINDMPTEIKYLVMHTLCEITSVDNTIQWNEWLYVLKAAIAIWFRTSDTKKLIEDILMYNTHTKKSANKEKFLEEFLKNERKWKNEVWMRK